MPPVVLSRYLGQEFPPTPQQAAVIGAEPGPLLVVAGAGAGKTETMAARVVWLVANGYVRPEEILGLTFTRKAAQELGRRINDRLAQLAENRELIARLDPSGGLADALSVIAPTVSTYDAFAGDLIREYGLLIPVEPDARLITAAELHAIAHDVVVNYRGTIIPDDGSNTAVSTVVEDLLALVTSIGNELFEPDAIREHAGIFTATVSELPREGKVKTAETETAKWSHRQLLRVNLLPLAEELARKLRELGVVTFNEQMSAAAKLARDHAAVGVAQRRRFRVVMLDEYQDTSHAQRVLLRSLFGEGRDSEDAHAVPLTVTAVGDPMQAIYGWRGATVANLANFQEDFPATGGQPAPKLQLTTSWRNPAEVLGLANGVADAVLGTGEERAVAPLEARPGAGPGDVALAFFEREEDEVAFVAENLAEQYRHTCESGEKFTAAVLVRKNASSAEVAEALDERGVPYEIVGLSGLLDVPEVADTVAIATMLVRPWDSAAALRVLAGPAVGLGLADLQALADRATNLQGSGRAPEPPAEDAKSDPSARFEEQLAALVEEAADIVAAGDPSEGLADAVADLGEAERYSEEGLRRLHLLASRLRWLRTHSLGKRLPYIFADIVEVFGIRTEVLARGSSTGTVHLDRLLEEVAAYPGTSMGSLLDYFDLAREQEDGLAPGNVAVRADRVQVLTAHKAKGLEWDTVAVVHADKKTYSAKADTFLSYTKYLPEEVPEFDEAGDIKDFFNAGNAYKKRRREIYEEEAARLFYVAVTRAKRKLLVTGSARRPGVKKATGPYVHFEAMRERAPQWVVRWDDVDEKQAREGDSPNSATSRVREGVWPHLHVSEEQRSAAELVAAARGNTPTLEEGTRFQQWEMDATALIDEFMAEMSAEVPVVFPGELTASDVVALKADPEQFARRARRPVPFKPNSYAKRGTAFHEWVEQFYGARPLLTEDELPGADEADVDRETLEQLKSNFEASRWAGRVPAFVEQPFEIALGESVVRGRMDAVFDDGDGWTVVDWKTGTRPDAAAMEAAKLQLAVYREAWRRIAGDGRDVRAVFFYVRTAQEYAPTDLPDRARLERLLRESSQDGLQFPEGSGK
ncbi:ATP-dependent helicase [Corynebacterium capitovis]|uniref:ATP-dependent helicase n=1 Tax=Corynebacterium capitovis TaxID=131081 RepID=UPI00039A2276|nr:UvrD-helicase domain-containing protein [Corynebacterium capitovis]